MNSKVDDFITKAPKWQQEMQALREILLECMLFEEIKWGQPCYMYQNSNVAIIGNFKDHCVLSFLKGVLLLDTEKILTKPGENSQSVRFIRFTNLKEITDLKQILKSYIFEAIEVEKQGLKPENKAIETLELPEELVTFFNEDPNLKTSFEALTPGRQRAYIIHFTGAKQSKTIIKRIENYRERIINGYGFNDCICGKSKKMPTCDGSHKYI